MKEFETWVGLLQYWRITKPEPETMAFFNPELTYADAAKLDAVLPGPNAMLIETPPAARGGPNDSQHMLWINEACRAATGKNLWSDSGLTMQVAQAQI